MLRKVRFNGLVSDVNVKEILPIYIYNKYKDTIFLDLEKGNEYWLNEEQYSYLPSSGFEVIEVKSDVIVKDAGVIAFTVDTDSGSPNYGTAPNVTYNHTIGNKLYEVTLIDTENYEVLSKDNNNFVVKRKLTATDATSLNNSKVSFAVIALNQ